MSEDQKIPIVARLVHRGDRTYLQLTERLASRNSYLSAQVEVNSGSLTVRVWTLDDVTILDILDNPDVIAQTLGARASVVTGELVLRDARELRVIPVELTNHAARLGRDVRALSTPDLRYAVTFIEEASDPTIRLQRIEVVVATLPELSDGPHD